MSLQILIDSMTFPIAKYARRVITGKKRIAYPIRSTQAVFTGENLP